ncbi:MAG: hypothetical protein ACRDRS_15840 [Pseudonocardiaceae bacterium]
MRARFGANGDITWNIPSGGLSQLRLSISSLNGARIDTGLDRLATVLHDRGVLRLATGT